MFLLLILLIHLKSRRASRLLNDDGRLDQTLKNLLHLLRSLEWDLLKGWWNETALLDIDVLLMLMILLIFDLLNFVGTFINFIYK